MSFPQESKPGSIYHKVGQGIKSFYRSDPDVFNPSHQVQVMKVLDGGYAYINDKSSMQIVMQKYCDLALAREEFLPLHYAIGLQQGSLYTDLFSEQ